MSVAATFRTYLEEKNLKCDEVHHRPTATSAQTAEASHVSGDCVAKGVVLSCEGGVKLAVVPASCNVRLDAIHKFVEGPVSLASEDEIVEIFYDCDPGAIPPSGTAYGIDTIVDDSLNDQEDVYLEAGDHETLLHLTRAQFQHIQENWQHGKIAVHM